MKANYALKHRRTGKHTWALDIASRSDKSEIQDVRYVNCIQCGKKITDSMAEDFDELNTPIYSKACGDALNLAREKFFSQPEPDSGNCECEDSPFLEGK